MSERYDYLDSPWQELCDLLEEIRDGITDIRDEMRRNNEDDDEPEPERVPTLDHATRAALFSRSQ